MQAYYEYLQTKEEGGEGAVRKIRDVGIVGTVIKTVMEQLAAKGIM